MRLKLRVTVAARRDLVTIGRFSFDRWGESQMVLYLTALESRFKWLARNPSRGRPAGEVKPGLLRFVEGRHVIYYRISGATLVVIRVLHQRMVPRRHIR